MSWQKQHVILAGWTTRFQHAKRDVLYGLDVHILWYLGTPGVVNMGMIWVIRAPERESGMSGGRNDWQRGDSLQNLELNSWGNTRVTWQIYVGCTGKMLCKSSHMWKRKEERIIFGLSPNGQMSFDCYNVLLCLGNFSQACKSVKSRPFKIFSVAMKR